MSGLAVLVIASMAAPARAAFPGENGLIAFERAGAIWTMQPDGSQPVQITSGTSSLPDAAPAWSPDGTKIAFQRRRPACTSGICTDIWIVHADGSSPVLAIGFAATPAWSPDGGQLTFIAWDPALPGTDTIWKANLDGTGRTEVYDYEEADQFRIGAPAWSPDGSKILFHEGTLETVCNPDLEECANLYPEYLYTTPASPPNTQTFGGPRTPGAAPNWSPDGHRHTFNTPAQTPEFEAGDFGGRIGVQNSDGGGRQLLTPGAGYAGQPGFDSRPAWSPDGRRIVFERNGDGIHVIEADGSGDVRLAATGKDPDWQPVQRSYVRPAGATPLRVPLVPAFRQCVSSNRTHGPPLAFPSCAPPIATSPTLTVGVGDGDPATARSIGFMRLRVVPGAPGGVDDADVRIRFSLSNVMWASDLTDYTGNLRSEAVVRLTDRDGFQRQTVEDFPFGFTAPCATTAGAFDGALCEVATSAEAVLPGSVTEGTRAIWSLDRVKVYDGGPVGDGANPSLFAVQGVFVP